MGKIRHAGGGRKNLGPPRKPRPVWEIGLRRHSGVPVVFRRAARSAQSVAGQSLRYTRPSTPGHHVLKIAKLANVLEVEPAVLLRLSLGAVSRDYWYAAASLNVGYT